VPGLNLGRVTLVLLSLIQRSSLKLGRGYCIPHRLSSLFTTIQLLDAICLWLYSFCWTLAALSDSKPYTLPVGVLRRGIGTSQGLCLHTERHKQNKHIDIRVSSGIRTHDPSFRARENSSCFRPRGCCDRLLFTGNVVK
jgi:hypothetical protein